MKFNFGGFKPASSRSGLEASCYYGQNWLFSKQKLLKGVSVVETQFQYYEQPAKICKNSVLVSETKNITEKH